MSDSLLTEISCPNCLAPIDLEGHGSSISCGSCQSNFILEGHLCSGCAAYYKNEVAVCGRCGTNMTRHCRKCHTDNWSGDEYCKSCGTAMDLLDMAAHSHAELSAQHRDMRMEQIKDIRAQGEESSRQRMAELNKREQQRQASIKARKQSQQTKDIVTFVIAGLVVVGVIAIVVTFLLA